MPTPVSWRSLWTSLAENAGTARPPGSGPSGRCRRWPRRRRSPVPQWRSPTPVRGPGLRQPVRGSGLRQPVRGRAQLGGCGRGIGRQWCRGGLCDVRCRGVRRLRGRRGGSGGSVRGSRGGRRSWRSRRNAERRSRRNRRSRGGTLLGHEAALGDRVGHHAAEERAGADGVVVARDHVGDHVGVTVGVDDRDDRQAQLVGLGYRDVLLLGVDHEDGVGQLVQSADPPEVALELLQLPGVAERLLLRHRVEVAGLLHGLEFLHPLDPGGDGLEVGEHAAQPALVHVRHPAGLGVDGDRPLGLLLGTDEEDGAAPGHEVADVPVGLLDAPHRLAQVDQVDPVALPEDEPAHLGVPPAGLVPEVDARAQQLLHGDDGHLAAPCDGWSSPTAAPQTSGRPWTRPGA